jgi:hypothetical protein
MHEASHSSKPEATVVAKRQRARLLPVLRERGPRGISGAELLSIGGTGGRSRLTELRRAGCWIESKRNPRGPWTYILLLEPSGPRPPRSPRPPSRRRVPPPQLSLPLFTPEARA